MRGAKTKYGRVAAVLGVVAAMAAAAWGGEPAKPDFAPGQEVKVDDPSLGGLGYYLVYVPAEYTPERTWPAVFCYHGLNQKPTTYPFRQVLGGKGYVVIGMCYSAGTDLSAYNGVSRDAENLRRLVPELVRTLKLDERQLFIGGFSMGGWMTSAIGEATSDLWAGMAICGAGRRGGPGTDAGRFRGKAVYVGAGETDDSHDSAEKAADAYRREGAAVIFETYAGKGHTVDTGSKTFRDWLWDSGPLKVVRADLAKAKAAQAAGRLGEAYKIYRQVAAVPGDHEPCKEAAQAAEAIAAKAQEDLGAADAAVTGRQYREATALYARVASSCAGCEFGDRASKAMVALQADPAVQAALESQRINAEAGALEEQARAYELAKDYAKAIQALEQYVARYPKADRYAEVKAHLEALKSDKAIQAAILTDEAQRDCRNWLNMADNFAKAGLKDRAREYLQRILDKYPDTEWGKQAREKMKGLR